MICERANDLGFRYPDVGDVSLSVLPGSSPARAGDRAARGGWAIDRLERGTLVHRILERFFVSCKRAVGWMEQLEGIRG